MKDDVSRDLLENALDYLASAAESADGETSRDWKYALLHLVAAVELLLKARLYQEHWSLVFADVDKADRRSFLGGDFVSVEWNQALDRLRKISGVELGERQLATLRALRKHRNRAQHFAMTLNRDQVVPPLAYGYHFCLEFIEQQLGQELTEEGRRCVNQVAQKLTSFDEFVDVRLEELKPRLKSAHNYIYCPRCWQEALELGDGNPRCLFCGFSDTPEAMAGEMAAESGPEPCPECGGPCMRLIGAEDRMGWGCLECGEEGDYETCTRCGALISGEPMPGEQCPSCWKALLDKD